MRLVGRKVLSQPLPLPRVSCRMVYRGGSALCITHSAEFITPCWVQGQGDGSDRASPSCSPCSPIFSPPPSYFLAHGDHPPANTAALFHCSIATGTGTPASFPQPTAIPEGSVALNVHGLGLEEPCRHCRPWCFSRCFPTLMSALWGFRPT